MLYVEALGVVVIVALLVYGLVTALTRPSDDRVRVVTAGEWHVTHYESAGATRVVVRKVADGVVVDEHLVAAIPVSDAAYDERFLEAMAVARQRRALFEAADEG